jgi:hypothetical protein
MAIPPLCGSWVICSDYKANRVGVRTSTALRPVPKSRLPDGRMAALRLWVEGGKSGLHGGTVPGNARRGRPQGKCHRKYTAGLSRMIGRAARVKRCGKSAPRRRQRRRQGKPHREQDQVGAAGIPLAGMPGGPSRRRSGRSHEALGNGRPRGMAIPASGPGPQAGQNPAYTPSGALFRRLPCGRSSGL